MQVKVNCLLAFVRFVEQNKRKSNEIGNATCKHLHCFRSFLSSQIEQRIELLSVLTPVQVWEILVRS